MNDFRCSNCNKLLAKVGVKSDSIIYSNSNGMTRHFKVEISCPKCKSVNISDVLEPIE